MAVIPKSPFPNVPKLPGVPQIARSAQFPASIPPALGTAVAAARLLRAFFAKPKWGVFKNPVPLSAPDANGIQTATIRDKLIAVVTPDNIREFGSRNEYSVSDYPVQSGGFTSYNKVASPFELTVRMTKGGTETARKNFLEQIEAIVGTTDLYQIITPEKVYPNCNVVGYELTRRGAEGAYFLSEVDLYFREIRQTTAQYTNTATSTQNAKNPSAVGSSNVGTVQAAAP